MSKKHPENCDCIECNPYGPYQLDDLPFDENETEFVACSECDGHPACEDFGCAFALNLVYLVHKFAVDNSSL